MSAVEPIALDEGQQSEREELTGSPPMLLNMLIAGAPGGRPRGLRARPGIRAWAEFPAAFPSTSPVVAMAVLGGRLIYVTDDLAIVGPSRKIFGIDGASVTDMSPASAGMIAGAERVSLRVWRDFAFAAGGASAQIISRGFSSEKLVSVGPTATPSARDVCIMTQRVVILGADDSGILYWSGLGESGATTWDQTFEFREAEARPDPAVACETTTRQLWVFGTETLQVFAPDPNETFAPETSVEVGCASKRSVVRIDQTMAWLDNRNRIVLSDGAQVTVLSDKGIGGTLDELATFSDCWGFRCKIGPYDLIAHVFPTAGITYAWDQISQTWSEWRRRDANGVWKPWAPTSYLRAFGKHLVGMPDGSIAELTLEAHADLTEPLSWAVRTGFREVPKRRHCVSARFICRRGEASEDATVNVRWRDDGGPFTPDMALPLGPLGDYEADLVVEPAGEPYRRRQWELSGSANAAVSIASGKETFEEAEF